MKFLRVISRHVLCSVIIFASLTVSAQNRTQTDLARENEDLRTEIDELEKSIDLIKNKMIPSKEELLQKLKLQALETERYTATLEAEVDSLESQYNLLLKQQKVLQTRLAEYKALYSDLQRQFSEMKGFRQAKADRQYETNLAILAGRYSGLTVEKIELLDGSRGDYKSRPDFYIYAKRIDAAIQNRKVYQQAVDVLDNPYDATSVAEARKELRYLLSIESDDISAGLFKLSDEQYVELDSLDIKLSRFKNGMAHLKSIVAKVNSDETVRRQRAEGVDKEACIAIMSEIVLPKNDETKSIYERYFNMIPFLERMIHEYWMELQADPFSIGTIGMKIEQM